MSSSFTDLFSDDAFTVLSLTAAINELDTIPGRAGQLAFADAAEGVTTTGVAVEIKDEALSLIPVSARGGPAPKEVEDKSDLIAFNIPHIALEDTIYASQVQDVREFGTSNELRTVESAVNTSMHKMASRLDFTMEHLRLGALKGQVKDADGSTLVDLFAAFGILNTLGQPEPETFGFALDDAASDVRLVAQAVHRFVRRNAKMPLPATMQVWGLAGDDFFDKFISHPKVKAAYNGTNAAKKALGDNFVDGVFEFAGIFWQNYIGSDDQNTISIEPDEARIFLSGVPGLYVEYFAPGDFLETVNTKGLPRYAKIAPDRKFGKSADLHVQSNPLPLCLRPRTLVKATA